MADNVPITAGSGTDVATDDVGGVHYQRVKHALGADGSATDAVGGAGAVSAAVQRVTLASDDPAVTALQILDNIVAGNEAQVDIVAALPAGTNAIGKLAANSGVDIGDVDVTSVPTDPFGANADAASATGSISAKLRGIATALGITAFDLGSGTGGSRTLRFFRDTAQWIGGAGAVTSAVMRATLASDDPAVASLSVIDDWDESDRAKVNPIVGQAGIAAGAGAVGATVPRVTLASDDPAVASLSVLDDWDSTDAAKTVGAFTTVNTTVTRPADTTAYAANDCMSDSTSAPTSGGFTFTSAARISGGSGIITDLWVTSSNDPATLLQGELWIFDSAVTNTNDNSAIAISDADTLLGVAVIPFVMSSTVAGSGTTSYAHVQWLNIGFTCVGTANLRFLVKVKNAYTPASAEAVNFKLKILQIT